MMNVLEKAILNNTSEIIAIVDEKGIVKYKSPNIERILGWKPEELVGRETFFLTHPDDAETVRNALFEITRDGNRSTSLEYRCRHKDGTYKNVLLNAVNLFHDPDIQGILFNYRDITERKKTKPAISESDMHFREMFERHNAVMLLISPESGTIVNANAAAASYYGFSVDVLRTMNIYQINQLSREEVLAEMAAARNERRNFFIFPHRLSGGDIRTVEVHSTPISINGETLLFSIIHDITERIAAEEKLRKNQAELLKAKEAAEAASRAKSNFMANVSHELRTPMNGIIGFSKLISMSGLNKTQKEFNDMIKMSSEHLLELINDILDFSKLEAKKLKLYKSPFDITRTIKNSLDIISDQANLKGLFINYEIDAKINYKISADELRIKQVLINLLSNAVKFTYKGGITIKLFEAGLKGSDILISISISDTGIGIHEEKLEEIFEMFHQLDDSNTRRQGGAGLGLSIARGIIEIMGGNIHVSSVIGKGSTFTITIPVEKCEDNFFTDDLTSAGYEEAIRTPLIMPAEKLKILVAEDDDICLKLITMTLQNYGWEVTAAATGAEAVSLYRTEKFDAVIMDGQMPEMDGYEAARKIRELEFGTGRRIPIIALSAYAMDGDRQKFEDAGMDDYITKPIENEDILAETILRSISER